MLRSPVDRRGLLAVAATSLGVFALIQSCAVLPDIERGACGNAVVERELGEECDGVVAGALVAACEDAGEASCTFACAAAEDARRCQYVWDDTHACPPGYAAGADGVCSRPSGHFAKEALARLPVVAAEGLVGDLDGDGARDLVVIDVQGNPTITYFSADGAPLSSQTTAPGLVQLGNLSAPTDALTDDLLFPAGPALVTIQGRPGPVLSPKAYAPVQLDAAEAKLLAMPLVPGSPFTDSVPPGFDLPVRQTISGATVTFTAINPQTFTPLGELLSFAGVGAPISEPVLADLMTQPTVEGLPSGTEIVLASETAVLVGAPASGEVVTLDLEVDELAVSVLKISGTDTVGVVTTGPGPMQRRLRVLGEGPLFTQELALPDATVPQSIIALADLNQDGRLDAVTHLAVLLQTGIASTPFVQGAEAENEWTHVAVADLNGDGAMEVIATPRSGDLTVLQLGTPWVMTSTSIDVGGVVEELAIADFDGDGANDIVVTHAGTSLGGMACQRTEPIQVLYGRAKGLPEAPVLMGELPEVQRLTPIKLYLPALVDGLTDLAIESACTPGKDPVGSDGNYLGLFFGSTSRAFYAPFSPYAGDLELFRTIERVVIADLGSPDQGSLGAPDGHADVALIAAKRLEDGGDVQREIRIVPTVGDADMIDVGASIAIGATRGDRNDVTKNLPGLAVADVSDATPGPEVIALSFVGDPDALEGGVDVIGRASDGTAVVEHTPLEVSLPGKTTLARLRVLDYDGDGFLDIIALVAGDSLVDARWLRNLEGQGFEPQLLTPAIAVALVFDVARMQAPACFDFERPEVCAAGRATVVAGFGDAYACPLGGTTCVGLFRDSSLTGAVLVADFDSDGLEDLVMLRALGVEIHRQCSVSEKARGACEDGEEKPAAP